jgi:peptide/nickel transport system substrate-binding protein
MRARVTQSIAVLAAVVATSVVSAGAAGPSGGVREGGTFRVALPSSQIESIDPFLANKAAMAPIFDATCGSLLHYRDEPLPARRELVPELAAGLPRVSNSAKTYAFTLRSGFRFSTGAPVTARDVAATVGRALRLKSSYWAANFRNVIGARAFESGRAARLRGVTVRGNRITFRLAKPQPDFAAAAGLLCVFPAGTTLDPEGVRAPVPSAGPYTLSSYVPGRLIALVRNRFYGGSRPHHVDRIEVTIADDPSGFVDAVERGSYDWAFVPPAVLSPNVPRLVARYGVNRDRFFVRPGRGLCMFVLNSSRPLFRNNPELRRAVSFAVDRRAFVHEAGARFAVAADQYLEPQHRSFHDVRIYSFRPDLKRARALARGNRRSGKAVFYTRDEPQGFAYGAIMKANLARIGLDVEVKAFPFGVTTELLPKRGEPFDIGWICWIGGDPEALNLHAFFDGRTLDQPEHLNWSHFNAPVINRRLDQVSRLTGRAFDRAYADLDADLARDYAPAVTYAYLNERTLVSARTGCVVTNPFFDLAAVCLKN